MKKFVKEFIIKEIIPPFNFSKSAKGSFFAPWNYSEDCLYGVIRLESGKLVKIELRSKGSNDKSELAVKVISNKKIDVCDLENVQQFIVSNFGLKEDLNSFYALTRHDPILKQVIEDLYGTRLVGNPPFISMVITICSQNTTLKMAQRMIEKMVENFGDTLKINQEIYHSFPTHKKLAALSIKELMDCKLGYKARYIKNFAEMVDHGKINLESIRSMSIDEAEEVLTSIKGIGPYTARVMLLFAFRKYESFWVDVLVRKIMSVLYFNNQEISDREIINFVDKKWADIGVLLCFIF